MIRALAVIKEATSETNKKYGMDEVVVNAISEACKELIKEAVEGKIGELWDSEEISFTDENINKYVSEKASFNLKDERGDKAVKSVDVSKNMSENLTITAALNIATVLGISGSLIPALKKLEVSLKFIFDRMKDIVKIGSFAKDSQPQTLGDGFSCYMAKIGSSIKVFQRFLSKISYLETDSTVAEPNGFMEELVEHISEITGCPFLTTAAKLKQEDIHNTMVEISGGFNVIGQCLKDITMDMNYFPEAPQYELDEVTLVINDLEEGTVVLRENLVPTHREIIIAVTTQLAYNHSSVVFAANNYTRSNYITFKTMMGVHILRSLQLIVRGVEFITSQLFKTGLPTVTKRTKSKSPFAAFGNIQISK